jgi:NTE family protein
MKKCLTLIFFCSVILLNCLPAGAQVNDSLKRPRVALVLSGGGAKGFAHIGVLKVLEEEGIPVDIIVGTSMGSIVGGIYSLGYTAAEVEAMVKKQDWKMILSDDVPRRYLSKDDLILKQRYLISLPLRGSKTFVLPQGIIRGQNVVNLFCGITGNVPVDADFTKFPIQFACVAVDLETGDEVVMKNGFLPSAMFSSMAIPGVFQPSERDGHMLIDGGFANNFPADVARQMGADIIIGVDIQSDRRDKNGLNSANGVLSQLIGFLGADKDSINHTLCDLVIKPDITGYSVASFSSGAADTLIARGEDATRQVRDKLREMKLRYHLTPNEKSRALVSPEKWKISSAEFSGISALNEKFLRKTINLKFPGEYSYDEIKASIDRLYGYGGFERITFYLIPDGAENKLHLNVVTRKVSTINLGFKVNTIDAAAVLLNATVKNYGNSFGLLSVSAELSANPGLSVTAESNKVFFMGIGTEAKMKYQKYKVYNNGDKIYNADIFYQSASMYLFRSMRRYHYGLGVQEEYFSGGLFSALDSSDRKDFVLMNGYAYFALDNTDNFYFPNRGTNMHIGFSVDADVNDFRFFYPVVTFKMKNVIPLFPRTVLLFDVNFRGIFNKGYPVAKNTLVGGDVYSQYFDYHFPFLGLPTVTLANPYMYLGSVGIRLQFVKSHYLSFIFNTIQQGDHIIEFDKHRAVYGGGIKYSLKTFAGPVDVGIGYSGSNHNVPTFSANFGYWF